MPDQLRSDPSSNGGALVAALAANRAEGNVDRLVYDRFFQGKKGVFVDVGAERPNFLSMSAWYRCHDWEVVAIEPNPAYREQYVALGLNVLEYAVGSADGDDVEFSVVSSHGTNYRGGNLSFESFSSLGIKDSYGGESSGHDITKIRVKLRTLDSILKEHAPKVDQVDIVSVDIEGWELEALSGLNFDRYSPKILIVENLRYDASYRDFMEARGYTIWRCLAPNDIYVRNDIVPDGTDRIISVLQVASATLVGRVRVVAGKIKRRIKAT